LDGETTVETLIHALRNLGPVRLAIMGAIMLGMIGFFIFLTTRLATPSMVLLYGDLNADDSSRITSQLSSQNVPFELLQGGSQIMVPSDRALKLRLSLASQGIPSGGSLGYELPAAPSATSCSTISKPSAPPVSCKTSICCAPSKAS